MMIFSGIADVERTNIFHQAMMIPLFASDCSYIFNGLQKKRSPIGKLNFLSVLKALFFCVAYVKINIYSNFALK